MTTTNPNPASQTSALLDTARSSACRALPGGSRRRRWSVALSLVAPLAMGTSPAWSVQTPPQPRLIPGQGTPMAPSATPIVPTGDPALDSLQRRFGDLARWLGSRPTIGADERAEIDRFRRAAAAVRADHPRNPAVVAMLAQAAAWIGDDEDAEGQFRLLAELRPSDGNVVASWSEYWLSQRQPETALLKIERNPRDLLAYPRLALAKAQALAALDRWEEAQQAIDLVAAGGPGGAVEKALPLAGTLKLEELRRLVSACLEAWPEEQALRIREAEADDLPRVEIVTSRGPIVVELFENQAPNTVANFVSLAEKGFYDGTRFAGSRPGVLVTGGDPDTKPGASAVPGLPGGPGYTIADEHALPGARKHFRGSLAMASPMPDGAGSQFYISIVPAVLNNGQRTVFGRVIEGMPVAMRLEPTDSIVSTRVLRRREHAYVPVKVGEETKGTEAAGTGDGTGSGTGNQESGTP